jgi:hypothetical protein
MLIWETIRGPSELPITVADVKRWIYRDTSFTDDDDRNHPLAMDAIEAFQNQADLMICNQRIKWHPWRFGNQNPERCQGYEMFLPFGNNSEVVVEYLDSDGILQTFPATDYKIVKREKSAFILSLEHEKEWPTDVHPTMIDAISIIFDCGWPVGDLWVAGHDYVAGDMILPTKLKQRGMAYICDVSGKSGTTEPVLTTEIGATTAEGPDTLVWECVGKTVPANIVSALLSYCGEKSLETGTTMKYPNLNVIQAAWDSAVSNWRIHLA